MFSCDHDILFGSVSFPMHTNILWLLYMNIFNDMEKVVDFLFFFFKGFLLLELEWTQMNL